MPLVGSTYVTLATHLADVRRLLRDNAPGALYTDSDLTSFINRAIKQRDLDLGCNRVQVRWTLTAGVYQYYFNDILATAIQWAGNQNSIIYDLMSVIIIPIGDASSAVRYPLGRWPYSRLAMLLSTSYPTYPAAYALYGPSTVFFGPPPAGNYPCELDFLAYAPDLVGSTDLDSMPIPWTDPVPFQAAAFAKQQAQRFDEAQQFEQLYQQRLRRVMSRTRSQAIPNPWSDFPLR